MWFEGKRLSESKTQQVINGLNHFLREGDSQPHMLSVVLPRTFKNSFCLFLQLWFDFSFTSHRLMETETLWHLTFLLFVDVNEV